MPLTKMIRFTGGTSEGFIFDQSKKPMKQGQTFPAEDDAHKPFTFQASSCDLKCIAFESDLRHEINSLDKFFI